MPDANTDPKFDYHDKDQAKILYENYFSDQRLNTAIHNFDEVHGLAGYYSYELIDTKKIPSPVTSGSVT